MIRHRRHSENHDVLILEVDQTHWRAIGGYQPARREESLGRFAYVMPADQLDSLKSWTQYAGIPLLATDTSGKPRLVPLQCGNTVDAWTVDGVTHVEKCCAPYRAGDVPAYCGACGEPAKPEVHGDTEPEVGTRCPKPSCGHLNRGGGVACVKCGAFIGDLHRAIRDTGASARSHSDPSPVDPWQALRDVAARGVADRVEREARSVAAAQGMPFYGADDWADYRAFWATLRGGTLTGGSTEWDGYGRPADLAELTVHLHPELATELATEMDTIP